MALFAQPLHFGDERGLPLTDDLRREGVDLVEQDGLGLAREIHCMGVQFGQDSTKAFQRLHPVVPGDVHYVQQYLAAFQMGQELVAEPHSLARALEQPGDVRQSEDVALARPVDHAEHGLEGSERIVRHFGLGVRQPAEKRRFAGVRQTGQTGIGDEAQGEPHPEAVAFLTPLPEVRPLTYRVDEAGVTAPASAAFGYHHPLPIMSDVHQELVLGVVRALGAVHPP